MMIVRDMSFREGQDQHDGHDDRRQRVAGQNAPVVAPGPFQGREVPADAQVVLIPLLVCSGST